MQAKGGSKKNQTIIVRLLTEFTPFIVVIFFTESYAVSSFPYLQFKELFYLLQRPELLWNPIQHGGPSSIHALPGQKHLFCISLTLYVILSLPLTAVFSLSRPHTRYCNSLMLLCTLHQIRLTKVFGLWVRHYIPMVFTGLKQTFTGISPSALLMAFKNPSL